jgi:hypothetical protein
MLTVPFTNPRLVPNWLVRLCPVRGKRQLEVHYEDVLPEAADNAIRCRPIERVISEHTMPFRAMECETSGLRWPGL